MAQALATQHLHAFEPASAAHCAVCVSVGGAAPPPAAAAAFAAPATAYVSLAQAVVSPHVASSRRSACAARAPPAGRIADRS